MKKDFMLLASDYGDTEAYDRRMQSRPAHVAVIDQLREAKKALLGAAILDAAGKMVGSTIFLQMTQDELDEYLKTEPYIVNKVWEKVEVRECKIGPSFLS